jgi:hypothetical protein
VVVVQVPEKRAPAGIEAGAIRDARLRQQHRRRRVIVAAVGVLAAGTLVAVFGVHLGSGSTKRRGVDPRRLTFERARRSRSREGWHISPALEGGQYGWCIGRGGGGSCPTLPVETPRRTGRHGQSKEAAALGAIAGTTEEKHEVRATALLSGAIHGVLLYGHPTALVTHALLPYGLRLVEIVLPRGKSSDATGSGLVALGPAGKPLGALSVEAPPAELVGSVRWWERPQTGAPGPCQIGAHRLPGLESEWGHVAATIEPYPGKIIGRAFFSCADTEYYLRKWPLETAILLDAQRPGTRPAAIPGMTPTAGSPGTFNAPGDSHGDITGMRHGNAWLVVAGGSGLPQRLEVLRHLTATVRIR